VGDPLQIFVSICGSIGTIAGAVYAVRYEVRKRVDDLNQQVIQLQDRKIKLLEDALVSAQKRIGELEGAVAVLTERRKRRAAIESEDIA
jgi:uncharacterized coiled-coil DUF342 family protein